MINQNLDYLTGEQEKVRAKIKDIAKNYRQASAAIKTAEFIKETIHQAGQQWDKFETQDTVTRTKYGDQLQHAYFQKDYYGIIAKGYEDLMAELTKELEKFGNTEQGELNETHNVTAIDNSIKNQPRPRQLIQVVNKENSSVKVLVKSEEFLINTLNKMLDKLKIDTHPCTEEFCRLKARTIEQYWNDIKDIHQKLWNLSLGGELEDYELEQYCELQEITQNELIKLYEAMSKGASQNIIREGSSPMKLPKIFYRNLTVII